MNAVPDMLNQALNLTLDSILLSLPLQSDVIK